MFLGAYGRNDGAVAVFLPEYRTVDGLDGFSHIFARRIGSVERATRLNRFSGENLIDAMAS